MMRAADAPREGEGCVPVGGRERGKAATLPTAMHRLSLAFAHIKNVERSSVVADTCAPVWKILTNFRL